MKRNLIVIMSAMLLLGTSACAVDDVETPVETIAEEIVETPAEEEDVETPSEVVTEEPKLPTNIPFEEIKELYGDNIDLINMSAYFMGKEAYDLDLVSLSGDRKSVV